MKRRSFTYENTSFINIHIALSISISIKEKLKAQTEQEFCLTSDISLTSWERIEEFRCKLDGNEKKLIKSFKTGPVYMTTGLIRGIESDGVVKNVNIEQ